MRWNRGFIRTFSRMLIWKEGFCPGNGTPEFRGASADLWEGFIVAKVATLRSSVFAHCMLVFNNANSSGGKFQETKRKRNVDCFVQYYVLEMEVWKPQRRALHSRVRASQGPTQHSSRLGKCRSEIWVQGPSGSSPDMFCTQRWQAR